MPRAGQPTRRPLRSILACLGLPLLAACSAGAGAPAGAGEGGAERVVVYTSVDQNFAEPILREFEAQTGIEVEPVFDVEAAKTTGLVNRLIAEKDRPQADVWWNGEFAQTIALAEQGLLAPYPSPMAEGIPDAYVDPESRWTGFGGRARVFLVNTRLVEESDYPRGLADFDGSPTDPDQTGIAYPMFGTTATQAAALYALWGPERARAYFQELADRGVRVVDGNSVVRDLVAAGQLAFGLTDTDDACGAIERGAPVAVVFPDQGEGEIGTLIIPNTVAKLAGAPHPEAAERFIDYLLAPETEARLVETGWSQVSLRPLPVDADRDICLDIGDLLGMDVGLAEVAAQMEAAQADMAQIFVR